MSKELSTNVNLGDMMALSKELSTVDVKDLAEITSAQDYFNYIQLHGGSSTKVSEGAIGVGHFGLTKNKELNDLGKEFQCIILGVRPKAMQFKPTIQETFDQHSPEFEELKRRSFGTDSGCGFGPELLLYVPALKDYATYFLSSKTGRNASDTPVSLFGQGKPMLSVKSKLIENKDYKWHGPVFSACEHDLELPTDMAELKKKLEAFANPEVAKAEIAEKVETKDKRA